MCLQGSFEGVCHNKNIFKFKRTYILQIMKSLKKIKKLCLLLYIKVF